MITHLVLLLRLLVVSPAEGAALASTAPAYLDAERAADHLRWARFAGAVHGIDPNLLLAIAWHESRYSPGEVTRESRGRVSCGVMTPVPHRAPCSAWELSTAGGYLEGAAHLRAWLNICRGPDRAHVRAPDQQRDVQHDAAYLRCAVLAYAGGGWLVRKCATEGVAEVRPGVDACALPALHAARARWIRRALASLPEASIGARGSRGTMPHITPHADVTRMLNAAQRAAVEVMIGDRDGDGVGGRDGDGVGGRDGDGDSVAATPEVLDRLAGLVHRCVLCQVKLGLWRSLGVQHDEGAKLEPLVVRAQLGRQLLGEPPVTIRYDFSRTALPLLVVRPVVRPVRPVRPVLAPMAG